jgi:hypothetical protein
MKKSRGEKNIENAVIIVTIFAVLPICGAVLAYWEIFGFGVDKITNEMERWGQTGDFFGGILNPAFGFLTVALLLWTLQQTERSLKQSEEELRLSREEMRRSADALSEQSKDLKQQTFERTFFELLRLYNEIVDGFIVKRNHLMNRVLGHPEDPPDMGRDALLDYCDQFKGRLFSHMGSNPGEEPLEAINNVWLEFYKDRQNQLGHYFRSLYNILKFVDQSKIENKKFYTDLLRAQLSSPELLIIFYNANSKMGREKLLPLLDKYNLLKHLDKGELMYSLPEED